MSFLSAGLTGLSHATLVFLVAAALTLVLDAARLLDFSQASLAGLAAAMATRLPIDPAAALVAIPLVLAGMGAALDLTLYRRLGRASLISQLTVTLGLFLSVRDAAILLQGGGLPLRPSWSQAGLAIGSLHLSLGTLAVLAAGPAIFALLRLLPRDDSGTRRRLVVPIAAALSGLAGTLSLLAPPAVSSGSGPDVLADALLAMLLGGLGNLPGALVAATILALVRSYTACLFPGATLAIPLAVTAAVLLVRPTGLLGRAAPPASREPQKLLIRPAPRSVQLLLAVGLSLAVVTPFFVPGALPLLAGGALAILFAASLHFLAGPGGMPSLGHAAFFGIAAAVTVAFVRTTGATLPMLAAALIAGTAAAGLAALATGLLVARLSTLAASMLTLVVAQLVTVITLPPGRLPVIEAPTWPILAFCVGGTLLLRRAIYSPFGTALRAARDDPARAAASGLPIASLRLAAFALAGSTAGLAGALTVLSTGAAAFTPALDRSAGALLMLAIGGVQAVTAPIIGALAVTGAADLLPAAPFWPLLLGPALVIVPLLMPDGIAGASIRAWRRAA